MKSLTQFVNITFQVCTYLLYYIQSVRAFNLFNLKIELNESKYFPSTWYDNVGFKYVIAIQLYRTHFSLSLSKSVIVNLEYIDWYLCSYIFFKHFLKIINLD